ncbi:hypothetical protein YC2023_102871 [Brassica napus]
MKIAKLSKIMKNPYCSSSHSELALLGRNAIVIADGMKDQDQEINEISGKIVRSTVQGKRCGIPPNESLGACGLCLQQGARVTQIML